MLFAYKFENCKVVIKEAQECVAYQIPGVEAPALR